MGTNRSDILFVTLDSCRYDTFVAAHLPNLKRIGELHLAQSPSHFTFGAHASFFMGFTPRIADCSEPFINPKHTKIFKLEGGGWAGFSDPYITLTGGNIVDGFRRDGYATLGSGAVGWFNPETETGRVLTADFEQFYFPADGASLVHQVSWLLARIDEAGPQPKFVFLNVGETHVPYWHEGAAWSRDENPCVPFGIHNDSNLCRERQRACAEYVDREIAPLLRRFEDATIIICADHGDAWGEDGIWEHGVSHAKTLEVPLLFRLAK
jgi:membrane-anchored protein YejM (alkaline phosphatase superfamily)